MSLKQWHVLYQTKDNSISLNTQKLRPTMLLSFTLHERGTPSVADSKWLSTRRNKTFIFPACHVTRSGAVSAPLTCIPTYVSNL